MILLAGTIFNEELTASLKRIHEKHPEIDPQKAIETGEKMAKKLTLVRLKRMGFDITMDELEEVLMWHALGSG